MTRPSRSFSSAVLFLSLAVFLTLPAHAEEKSIVLTEDVELKIADTFMAEGEYYRAITEYKKFLILFPDSERADYALFKMGNAYYKGEEYASAARTLSSLREKYPGSSNANEAFFLEAFSYWKAKQHKKARDTFKALVDTQPESEYAPRALAASSLVALDEDNALASRQDLERFIELYPEHPLLDKVQEALALIDQYRDLPQKSPVLAGVMSAIIPGSGYMYAGHYGDGATAFLINGLFIAGTVIGINEENYPVAAIVGGIGIPFYLGNIYGSANAAKKWNRAAKEEVRAKIHVALSPLL